MIYLLLPLPQWEESADPVATPGDEGFVHCCDERQVAYVRRRYFAQDEKVMILAIDPTQLDAEARYEPGAGGEPERFPHVYGTITRSSVMEAREA